MNKPSKIAAFTMVDIMTGMIITSIIISMVFYLFTSINKQVSTYGNVRNELNEFLLLKSDLKRQFEKSEHKIIGIPGGISILGPSFKLNYIKEGDLLIRTEKNGTDTLTHHLNEFEPVFVINQLGVSTEKISALNVSVQMDNQELSCHLFREYGPIDAINRSLLHEF
ncbi:MAG: hypothetical protein GQ574_22900 [Crocinitomix sp.]|nr:hypothetical protein [Crocinitomix sp.]